MKPLRALAILALTALLGAVISAPAAAKDYEDAHLFGLATGYTGLGDKSFNDMIHTGFVLMNHLQDITYKVATPKGPGDEEQTLQGLLDQGSNVVLAAGAYYAPAIEKLARRFPHVLFVLVNGQAQSYPPNVAAVHFAQNEASYLAGTLAAIMSKSGTIGFLGAIKNKDVEDFLVGYQAGARQARKRIRLETAWLEEAAQDLSPFAAPDAARKAALAMYADGCDIIFAVAAGSNIGVFEAARKTGNFAIGVDQDQDHMAPGYVLTSVVKRLDLAVFTMLRDILANRFQNKIHVMDLDSGAVGLSPMRYTKVLVPDETLRTLEQLKQAINAGRIHVPTADPVYRFSRRPQ